MSKTIIAIIIIIIVAGAGYWIYQSSSTTYTNQKYGYQVKHPRNWDVDASMPEEVIFFPTLTDFGVHIIFRNNPEKLPIKEWLEKSQTYTGVTQRWTNEENLIIGGYPAIKWADDEGGYEVWISKENVIFQVTAFKDKSVILNQMLSTFKFLD